MISNKNPVWYDFETRLIEGLVLVSSYASHNRPPEEVQIMERAHSYGATAVFFGAAQNGNSQVAQAFIYDSDISDEDFAQLHKKLWSWGGVPLLYRKTAGLLQLFRCAHSHDFVGPSGKIICNPIRTLDVATKISADPWWDAERLRNGTIWDDPEACKILLSANKSAHKRLITAVKNISDELNREAVLPKNLRRKLLILSLLIAYLEQRDIFPEGYFSNFLDGSTHFFEVLSNGSALVELLVSLEERFNGNVFSLSESDKSILKFNEGLRRFSSLVEGREEEGGQLSLWELYSFKDLPVELISHIYQLFVTDKDSSVYTPLFLVRLILEEVLSWERLDRIVKNDEIILDPACGSGVFLVEAYKRLVLHWRSRNDWKKPDVKTLKLLLEKIHGIDLEEGAVELAAFSLCLALCDALEPEEIRAQVKLFPQLIGETLHHCCFFDAKKKELIKKPVGVLVGNPPFVSKLTTLGAQRSYDEYTIQHGLLPDKQLAYLFLHDGMAMLAPGGVLAMLQQYNFLYNQKSLPFRQRFMDKWDVREVLDFVSVRGLFQKGKADTKIVVIVAEASSAPANRVVLHATFRRTGRADAEQGFDIDYYDLHWLSRDLIFRSDTVWRANLLGGGRVLELVDRLRGYQTLGEYAKNKKWDFGEGFIEAVPRDSSSADMVVKLKPAEHITGSKLLPSSALTGDGIDHSKLEVATATVFKSSYTFARYTAPMVVIHQQCDLRHSYVNDGYLTYKNQIVGFCGPETEAVQVQSVANYLKDNKRALQTFVAGTSVKLFTQHATTLSAADIVSLPYPDSQDLEISLNEEVIINDVVDYYRDLIRLGEGSTALSEGGREAVSSFAEQLTSQICTVYKKRPLKALKPQFWPGIICQPFVFGEGDVDWSGADELKVILDRLLQSQQQRTLRVTRICRLYDGNFFFLLKPDRLRYWLRSVALRDADEILSDLRAQGF